MSQVILTPTGWKYLPNTVSWPEKPTYPALACMSEGCMRSCYEEKEIPHNPNEYCYIAEHNRIKYENSITEASRHLVDIAEEDWAKVHDLAWTKEHDEDDVKLDTPYKIDAEFEVVGQYRFVINGLAGSWENLPINQAPDYGDDYYEYRQIARLVKPKEMKDRGFVDNAAVAELNRDLDDNLFEVIESQEELMDIAYHMVMNPKYKNWQQARKVLMELFTLTRNTKI